MSLLPRPGDFTEPYRGGPIGLYKVRPTADPDSYFETADYAVEMKDGLIFVLARIDEWCYVMTTKTAVLGWIDRYDLGIGCFPGTVYSMKQRGKVEA